MNGYAQNRRIRSGWTDAFRVDGYAQDEPEVPACPEPVEGSKDQGLKVTILNFSIMKIAPLANSAQRCKRKFR